MQTITVTLPKLHAAQIQIKNERKRFNVIDCGRRFGKNILLQDGAVATALKDALPVGWGAPTYKMLLDDWKSLTNTLASVTVRRSEQEKQVTLISGGVIEFFSLDGPDSIRGKKFKRFIVNEAAFVPNLLDIFNLVIRPTLIDYRGEADFAGTPKGMNGFWQLFNINDPDWMRWQMTSYENPHIPHSELDGLKQTMLERAFQQEIMGQFLEDGGGVFRNIMRCATATYQDKGMPAHQYVIGADWGRTNDATVFMVVDITTAEQVYMDRMLDTDFASQRNRLKALSQRFNNAVCLVEVNSIGQPQLEELQMMDVPVQGFMTTNATKLEIISALQLAFEQEKIKVINDPQAVSELMAYQAERLPSGLLRYGAPEGMHDDIVMALCLAWWAGFNGQSWLTS
jgi:terminase large subunit-like protein